MKRRNRPDRTGRGGHRFLSLPHYLLGSEAWRTLKPGPRALFVEIASRFNGTNNGRIGLGLREAGEAICIKDRQTVAAYFRELQARGFIVATRKSGFNLKSPDERRATEWAVTLHSWTGQNATKDFMRWRASETDGTEKPAAKDGKSARIIPLRVPDRPARTEIPPFIVTGAADSRTAYPTTSTSKP